MRNRAVMPEMAFDDSGLDRAVHLRGDPAAIARLWADRAARVMPIWRGKPLFAPQGAGLGWITTGHAVLQDCATPPIFLGLSDGIARFCQDMPHWRPQDQTLMPAGAYFDPSEQCHPDLPEGHVFAELRGRMALLSTREAELVATARALAGWHASHRFCAACGQASTIAQAGWQRVCPECGAAHFPRTDPVVIMLITQGNSTLLGRSPGWPDGMYSCLAGFMEPGETIEAAVRREVLEETGVPVGPVSYVASQPWPFPASLMLGCHGQALDRAITLDPVELEDALWVTRERLAGIFAGTDPHIRRPRKGAIAGALLRQWLADALD